MTTFKDRNFLLSIFYEGPWEKIMNFCWGIRKDSEDYRWVIGPCPKGWRLLLQNLAFRAEKRDQLWRAKYAIKQKDPHRCWKRRRNGDPEA